MIVIVFVLVSRTIIIIRLFNVIKIVIVVRLVCLLYLIKLGLGLRMPWKPNKLSWAYKWTPIDLSIV